MLLIVDLRICHMEIIEPRDDDVRKRQVHEPFMICGNDVPGHGVRARVCQHLLVGVLAGSLEFARLILCFSENVRASPRRSAAHSSHASLRAADRRRRMAPTKVSNDRDRVWRGPYSRKLLRVRSWRDHDQIAILDPALSRAHARRGSLRRIQLEHAKTTVAALHGRRQLRAWAAETANRERRGQLMRD